MTGADQRAASPPIEVGPFVTYAPKSPPARGLLLAILLVCTALVAGACVYAWTMLNDDAGWRAPSSSDRAGTTALTPEAIRNLPVVEPVRYLDVAPDDARAINAAVPFATRSNPAAASFRTGLDPLNLERAVDCLAAAAWYEAGDDAIGEQAVVQVVLNRVRHPSFPKSVCGVVFQGSERRTGCQFSFSCDGALARIPSKDAWTRARNLATSGLYGFVFRPVGWATHYHTDWVVPYWSSSVDKTAAVHTHLFFRWKGRAGDPVAFAGPVAAVEPTIPALFRISQIHRGDQDPLPVIELSDAAGASTVAPIAGTADSIDMPIPAAALRGNTVVGRSATTNSFSIAIKADAFAGDLALMALDLCRQKPDAPCTVTGRIDGSSASKDDADFYYFRDRSRGRESAVWNCARFPRQDAKQCMVNGDASKTGTR